MSVVYPLRLTHPLFLCSPKTESVPTRRSFAIPTFRRDDATWGAHELAHRSAHSYGGNNGSGSGLFHPPSTPRGTAPMSGVPRQNSYRSGEMFMKGSKRVKAFQSTRWFLFQGTHPPLRFRLETAFSPKRR